VFLLASMVWTTIAYGGVHQPIIALFYLQILCVVLLLVADSVLTGTLKLDGSALQYPIAAAVIYGLIQTIPFGYTSAGGVDAIPRTISLAPNWTRMASLQIASVLVFFSSLLALTNSARRISVVVRLVTVFGFIFAFFSILQSVLSPEKIYGIYESRHAVPFGSFVNRHNFAAFMEMSIALPLGLLFSGAIERDKRLLYVTATGLMGVALIMSGSRGGLVSIVAATAFLVFLATGSSSTRDKVVKASMGVLLVVVFIAGSALIGGESSLTRLAKTARSSDISTSRFEIWQGTLEVIRDNMPLGAGLAAFGEAYTAADPNSGIERVEQAHNDYLQVLADAGLVGGVIGLFFIAAFFKTGLRSIKAENSYRRGVALGAFSGCFAILVHSVFDFVLHTTAVALLFLALLVLLVAAGRSYEDDIEVKPHRRKVRRVKAEVTDLAARRS